MLALRTGDDGLSVVEVYAVQMSGEVNVSGNSVREGQIDCSRESVAYRVVREAQPWEDLGVGI